jgi:hypothetical protein
MSKSALETLRQVNAHLRWALTHFRPEQSHCLTIQPQDFSDLLAQLLQGAECLRNLSAHAEDDPEMERESSEYRGNLENLRQFLPDLHGRLLAEKTRLENAQMHVAAAMAWARGSKKVLWSVYQLPGVY